MANGYVRKLHKTGGTYFLGNSENRFYRKTLSRMTGISILFMGKG